MAHYEPPHQELRCFQIQLFLSLVLKELTEEEIHRELSGVLFKTSMAILWYQRKHYIKLIDTLLEKALDKAILEFLY